MKDKRIFSIFRVYDYKGGELSYDTNITLASVIGEVVESGLICHEDLDSWEDLYNIADEDLDKLCSEIKFEEAIYAGGDGTVMEIIEHVNNKLVSFDIENTKPYIADYIRRNRDGN